MKKILTLSLAFMLFSTVAFSQVNGSSYQTAVGLKFYPGSITIKHFIQENRAIEGLMYFWNYGIRFTGLYEFHGDFAGAPGLKWYAGPGAHIGFWNDNWNHHYPDRDGGMAIGIDGVLGLDYKFTGAPINLSLDWQPSWTFANYSYFESGWGGFAIRYTFR